MSSAVSGELEPQAWAPQVELAILSRQGGRPYNEDACGHWHSDRFLCCVVADGAGGMGGGDVASKLVVRHIIEHVAQQPVCDAEQVQALIVDSNEHVRRRQREADELQHMHTTVVALFVDLSAAQALWGHAGDSRLYLFRDGQMLARTRDHSVVQGLVDAGMLEPDQMQAHPGRSELRSALGTAPEHLMVGTASSPWALRAGDAFLLCTDGLWEHVDEAQMAPALHASPDAQTWLAELERQVLQHVRDVGIAEHDNYSAIGVWFGAR